jgi:anti-sigma-K factor RskA
MNYDDPKLADQLAAEYVLGTLRGQARWRFETMMARNEILSERVEAWDLQLNVLATQVPEIPPPPGAWEQILAQVTSVPVEQAERSTREGLAFWRRLAASATLVALIMGIVLLWPEPEMVGPVKAGYVVMLSDEQQHTGWIISAPPTMGELNIRPAAPMSVPEGKRCYLWLKPQGKGKVVSLGILPESDPTTLAVPESIRALLPGHLIVSMEEAVGTLPQEPSNDIAMQVEWMRPVKHSF